MKTVVKEFTRDDVRTAHHTFVKGCRKDSSCGCLMDVMVARVFQPKKTADKVQTAYHESMFYDGHNCVAEVNFKVVGNYLSAPKEYDDACIMPDCKSADAVYKRVVKRLGTKKIEFTYDENKISLR